MTIDQSLVDDYQPSDAVLQLVKSTKIALLVGISGAGKDTIKQQLLTHDEYSDIVSHTTRSPRTNNSVLEVDGHDYHFITQPQATEMLTNDRFVEAKLVHGTIYGTSAAEIAKAKDNNKIAITDIDVQGVVEYKKISDEVVAIFILPPDFATWRQRLASRYTTKEEFEAEWPKRRASAITELQHALRLPYYHFVINDDLARAVKVTHHIAHRDDAFYREDDEFRLRARDLLAQIKAAE